jgi:hypothetical protein
MFCYTVTKLKDDYPACGIHNFSLFLWNIITLICFFMFGIFYIIFNCFRIFIGTYIAQFILLAIGFAITYHSCSFSQMMFGFTVLINLEFAVLFLRILFDISTIASKYKSSKNDEQKPLINKQNDHVAINVNK